MSGSDSDSDCGLVRVNSVKKNDEYMESPRDIEFKIKFEDTSDAKPAGLIYKLKKGQELPYEPDLSGYQISHQIRFGMNLEPSLDGWTGENTGKYWIFTRDAQEACFGKRLLTASPGVSRAVRRMKFSSSPSSSRPFRRTSSNSSPSSSKRSVGSTSFIVDRADEDVDIVCLNSTVSNEDGSRDDFDMIGDDLAEEMKLVVKTENRIAPLKCALCSFICQRESSCIQHIRAEHPGWRAEAERVEEVSLAAKKKMTVHNNPRWKEELKSSFYEVIIEKCAQATIEAVKGNEIIKDMKKKRKVRNEIINATLDHLVDSYGGVDTPKLWVMREVVAMMGACYPSMFRDTEGGDQEDVGYGFGGHSGLSRLPEQMVDRFRDRDRLRKPSQEDGSDSDDEPAAKKGKKKDIYGVDNRKFYAIKRDPKAEEEIAKTNDEDDFSKRQAVFDAKQSALMHQIRNSKKAIHQVCRGFFLHQDHVAKQFENLTMTDNLSVAIRENFRKQTDFLLMFLKHKEKTANMRERLRQIDERVEVDFDGSTTYRDIEILRMAGSHFDSDGSVFLRYQAELPGATASPFIVAVQIDKIFVFELHVEKKLLLGNMNFAEALGAFLHVSFVFDLLYPKEAETLCDIIQRKFAGYGDDTGTRTNGKKTSAFSS